MISSNHQSRFGLTAPRIQDALVPTRQRKLPHTRPPGVVTQSEGHAVMKQTFFIVLW
ncbi:unnamed protein product, partial [Brassica napus]